MFDRVLAELVATRVLPPDLIEPDPRAYLSGLLASAGRSPASLYRRLGEDAAADAHLIEPFAGMAVRVLRADRIRLATLARAVGASAADAVEAKARVAENRCLIAWVTAATAFRESAYRYALEHLVLEAPQADAIVVERGIARLTAERVHLDRLGLPTLAHGACEPLAEDRAEPVIIERRDEPLVRKG